MCDGLMLQKDPKSTAAALIAHANKAFGGSQAEGAYSAKDAADLIELTVNQTILGSPALYDPRVDAKGAVAAIGRLAQMMSVVPTQTRRDEEQEQFQQFSTPPHLAYLVAWAANLTPQDVVLEPSAGVGGIAVFALNAGATVYVNELSERRSRLLAILPFKERFAENAEQLNNVLPAAVKPSVVLMNPPFSRSPRLKDRKDSEIGMRHIRQALLRLRPGGRMVVIMGDGMGDWSEIQKQYSVRASIGIPGKEYAKMGCAYPTRLLVVDKVKPDGIPCVTADAESVVGAVALLEEARRIGAARVKVCEGMEKINAVPVEESARRPVVLSTTDKRPEGGPNSPAGSATQSADATPVAGVPDGNAVVQEPPQADTLRISTPAAVNATPLSDAIFEAYRPQRLHVEGAHEHPTPLVQSAAMASVLPPAPTYAPSLPHELIETGALSEAQIEAVVYAGQAHRQYLPEVEVEDPITREKRRVKFRKGFMVGDGTGVGKGRQGAGCIMDSFARGCRRAMWITKNPKLLKDAIRDWTDLGGDKDAIVNLSKIDVAKPVPRSDRPQILFLTYALLRSGSKPRMTDPLDKRVTTKDLPVDPDFEYMEYIAKALVRLANKPDRHLFSAYSHYILRGGQYSGRSLYAACHDVNPEFNTQEPDKRSIRAALGLKVEADKPKDTGERSRLQQVIEWAGPSFDGVIWADESHCCKSSLA